MSRSRKHTPITGIAKHVSTKGYKKERASRERAHERDLTKEAEKGDEKAAERLEVEQTPWNEWVCERDGKQWFGDLSDKEYRDKLMRK